MIYIDLAQNTVCEVDRWLWLSFGQKGQPHISLGQSESECNELSRRPRFEYTNLIGRAIDVFFSRRFAEAETNRAYPAVTLPPLELLE